MNVSLLTPQKRHLPTKNWLTLPGNVLLHPLILIINVACGGTVSTLPIRVITLQRAIREYVAVTHKAQYRFDTIITNPHDKTFEIWFRVDYFYAQA